MCLQSTNKFTIRMTLSSFCYTSKYKTLHLFTSQTGMSPCHENNKFTRKLNSWCIIIIIGHISHVILSFKKIHFQYFCMIVHKRSVCKLVFIFNIVLKTTYDPINLPFCGTSLTCVVYSSPPISGFVSVATWAGCMLSPACARFCGDTSWHLSASVWFSRALSHSVTGCPTCTG